MDLFDSAARDELRARGPLASRLRPRTIDDVVGQEHLLGADMPLRRLIEGDRLQSVILWGPPGTGKTSIAHVISATSSSAFERLSAVSAGVKDVREVIDKAVSRLGAHGQRTILFLDEIHRFSKSQQDALLPAVEDGSIILIGATTENPAFQVNSALLSRSVLFRLVPLSELSLRTLIVKGCSILSVAIDDGAVDEIVRRSGGDGRQALALVDLASALGKRATISVEDVENAVGSTALRYGLDDHYDIISAFIKSMRGADPQATVLYLARMLASGEDPRFIARRLVIFASEDVGLADPQALVQAVAASQALELVGLPEAQLNLAQAAVYLATSPKSNSVAQSIWTARHDIENGLVVEVPLALRDGHYAGASALGHGVGYVNPHNDPQTASGQRYLPDALIGRRWYEPTNSGFEAVVRTRMDLDEDSTGGHRSTRRADEMNER